MISGETRSQVGLGLWICGEWLEEVLHTRLKKSWWVPKIKLGVWCFASICLTPCVFIEGTHKDIWWNTGAVLLFRCLAALESDSKLFGFHICNDGDRNKHATSVKGSSYRRVYSQVPSHYSHWTYRSSWQTAKAEEKTRRGYSRKTEKPFLAFNELDTTEIEYRSDRINESGWVFPQIWWLISP